MLNFLAEEAQTSSPVLTWGLLIVLVVAIIGMFVWQSISGRKKQKEAQDMVNSLKIGDRIKTIGGVCGFLVEINNEENTIVIETGTADKKSYIKFDKGAIYQTGPANPKAEQKQGEKAEKKSEEKAEEKVEATTESEDKADTVAAPEEKEKPAAKPKKTAKK